MAASSPRATGGRRWAPLVVALTAATLLTGVAVRDWAQDQVDLQFHAFQDSRGVTVLSPTLNLSKDFTDRTGLRLKFGVDAISAASDSCARCHQQGAHNQRTFAGASLVRKPNADTTFSIGAEIGSEKFYQATTLLTSITRNFNKGNTTVAGGYSFSWNRPMLHPSRQTVNQYENNAYVSVTQTLTRTTIIQAGYELGQINGYQNNPFLRTSLNGQLVLGQNPSSRTRHTLTFRVRQALPARTYLRADYRRYFDSWSLHSDTLDFGLEHRFSSRWLAGLEYRWYKQSGVSFYAPEYFGTPDYFTGDFRLEPFDSGLYSGRIEFTPKNGFLFLQPGTTLSFAYKRYHSNNGFDAAIFTTGLRVPLGGSSKPGFP